MKYSYKKNYLQISCYNYRVTYFIRFYVIIVRLKNCIMSYSINYKIMITINYRIMILQKYITYHPNFLDLLDSLDTIMITISY